MWNSGTGYVHVDLLSVRAEPSPITLSVFPLAIHYFLCKFGQDGLSRSLLTGAVL